MDNRVVAVIAVVISTKSWGVVQPLVIRGVSCNTALLCGFRLRGRFRRRIGLSVRPRRCFTGGDGKVGIHHSEHRKLRNHPAGHLPIAIASLGLLLSGFARCSAKDMFSVSSFSGVACEGLSPIVCNCFVIFPIWRAIRRNCVAEVALVKLILRRCHPSRLWAWWRAYTWYTGFGGRASHVLVLAVTPLMASGFHGFSVVGSIVIVAPLIGFLEGCFSWPGRTRWSCY